MCRLVAGLAVSVALAGCGGSSPPSSSSTPARTATPERTAAAGPAVVRGVRVSSITHALLKNGGPPRPTTADCREATAAERRAAPFGPTRRPLFTCRLTLQGEQADYTVQVLHNGCFVAERERAGMAVYGCGADRA